MKFDGDAIAGSTNGSWEIQSGKREKINLP
jgi:hypothetical protein